MSPQAALHSQVFGFFSALVAIVAVVSWVSILLLGRFANRDVSHARQSFQAWLIMAPLALAVIFLGRAPTIISIFGLAILGWWEYARATGLIRDRLLVGVVQVCVAALAAVVVFATRLPPPLHWLEVYLAMPLLATCLVVCIPIIRNRTRGEFQQITLAVFGFVYIGWMFGHLALLANSRNAYGYLMYLVFAVELNDISSYVFGRLLGRRALRSNISPKKTWAGAIGGLAVSLALPWLLRFSFPHFAAIELLLTGLIVGIGGPVGDLVMSLIKREAGVKDMGSILPGHGGLLDRIDSLIFVAPLFMHMLRTLDKFSSI